MKYLYNENYKLQMKENEGDINKGKIILYSWIEDFLLLKAIYLKWWLCGHRRA